MSEITGKAEEQPKVVKGGVASQQDQPNRKEEVKSQIEMSRKGIPDEIILISIAYDTRSGEIQVAGPIGNKNLFYGMLECARDCCVDWNRANVPGVRTP